MGRKAEVRFPVDCRVRPPPRGTGKDGARPSLPPPIPLATDGRTAVWSASGRAYMHATLECGRGIREWRISADGHTDGRQLSQSEVASLHHSPFVARPTWACLTLHPGTNSKPRSVGPMRPAPVDAVIAISNLRSSIMIHEAMRMDGS